MSSTAGTLEALFSCTEASHPVPGVPWSLHVRNVVSAHTHMHELNTEPFDCTVWSETSATQFTLDSIRTKARLAKAYLATSTAAGSRMLKGATATGRGHAVGSLIYSKCKARSLHKLWPDVVFQSGRVSDALITVGSFQLRVIGVYGYNSSIANADGVNEILFEEIFRHAASFSLPTVIAGDFNFDLQLSVTWQHYSQLGYVDVGKHSSALARTEPEPTYRGQSRLDYVVCNALAFQHVQTFCLDPKGYTDHATLTVQFLLPTSVPCKMVWDVPTDLASCPRILEKLSDAPLHEG